MFSKSPDLGDELFSKLDYCISVTWSDPRRFEHPVPYLVQCASIHAGLYLAGYIITLVSSISALIFCGEI
jgi:hypothetical protein